MDISFHIMRKFFIIILVFFLLAPCSVFAQQEEDPITLCRDSIDNAFQYYLYGTVSGETSPEDVVVDDIGFLRKLDSLYSTDTPTRQLVSEATSYLRDLRKEMNATCSLLRNPLGDGAFEISSVDALEYRVIQCAGHEFDVDQAFNLALYCDQRMNFYLNFVMDHVRLITLRSAQQKQASTIVKRYQEINKQLRDLSENIVRMVQFITKFNSALGHLITGSCQQ